MIEHFHEINVSPFATNVLDLVGATDLYSASGSPVVVRQTGTLFVISHDGDEICRTADNLAASYALNRLQVGRIIAPV